MKRVKFFAIFFAVFMFTACANARPPKPGKNFIWVERHVAPNGRIIPGHWKYVGNKPFKGKYWIKGHFTPNGKWIPGHWVR